MFLVAAKDTACSVATALKTAGLARPIFIGLVLCLLTSIGTVVYATYLMVTKKVSVQNIFGVIVAQLTKFAPRAVIYAGLAICFGCAAYITVRVVGLLRPQTSG